MPGQPFSSSWQNLVDRGLSIFVRFSTCKRHVMLFFTHHYFVRMHIHLQSLRAKAGRELSRCSHHSSTDILTPQALYREASTSFHDNARHGTRSDSAPQVTSAHFSCVVNAISFFVQDHTVSNHHAGQYSVREAFENSTVLITGATGELSLPCWFSLTAAGHLNARRTQATLVAWFLSS